MNSTAAQSPFAMVDTAPPSDLVSLRNFVVDEDRANLGSDLWKSLDKSAFVLAQREAIEAFNLARAMALSEQSAATEERNRLDQAEDAARSLARSWNVEGLQSTLLKNTPVPSSSSPRRHPSSSPPSRPIVADNPLASSSKVPPATTAESSSQQKRRKASISSSQPQYSYSTSNYSYPSQSHNQNNTATPPSAGTSHASVHAQQQQSQARKHSPSASSRDIQAGQILNPKESSPRTQSPSSSASAQAAAAEREKEKGKGKERSRSNSNSTSRKRSSSSAAQPVHSPQAQAQVQVPPQQAQEHQHGPRDVFSPVRFNCAKCGISISSIVLSQPSLTLTSPDPFAHPFASVLHVTCNNPSCGAVHCRACLQIVKCRDVDHPSSADSQALVPMSSSSSPPTRLAFSSSKSHHIQTQGQRACAGGPGCALWSCCPTVRVIAVWEALRAFDALFGAEAGFQVSNQQPQGDVVGRQYREAYIRTVISSKADKSMRRFEDGFVRVLKVVASWLQFPSEDGERRVDADDKSHVLLHLARLFLSSHLLEVVHTFLSNRNVKDWMTHAETYLDVLDVVGKMMDCGLGFLLKEVSGVQSPAPSPSGSGFYNPFAALPTSPASSLSPSPSQSPPPHAPLTLSSPSTLFDLVSQLETYRGDLKKFLTKVSFGVTVDKASKLHEAITYLVLQLVVGEF